MKHKCLQGKVLLVLATFYLLASICWHVSTVVALMMQWRSRPTNVWGDLCRKPLVSY